MVEEQMWFDCIPDMARNVDHCRAWDNRGDLIADGDYQLYFERRAATASELLPSLVKGAAGRYSGLVIYQFEYDRHNTFSRPLVLVSAINCIKFGERLSSFKAVGCN
jgi:hypothetical protein